MTRPLLRAVPDTERRETETDPWDRNDTDTDKSFEAFVVYRDLGPARTYTEVSRKLHKVPSLIKRWSYQHDWRKRVKAYDADKARDWDEMARATAWTVAERHAQLARALTTRGLQALQNIDPATLSPSDLARWIDLAVRIERDVYFPKAADVTAVNTVAQIVIDGNLLHGPTALPANWVDAEPEEIGRAYV